jgi:hypothetical protein
MTSSLRIIRKYNFVHPIAEGVAPKEPDKRPRAEFIRILIEKLLVILYYTESHKYYIHNLFIKFRQLWMAMTLLVV